MSPIFFSLFHHTSKNAWSFTDDQTKKDVGARQSSEFHRTIETKDVADLKDYLFTWG
jgi:hypothetical protein